MQVSRCSEGPRPCFGNAVALNLCMSMGSRENNKNKVRTQLWDTLYNVKLS